MKLFDKLLKGRQVDKSINKEEIQQPITPVKEEIPEKKRTIYRNMGCKEIVA